MAQRYMATSMFLIMNTKDTKVDETHFRVDTNLITRDGDPL